MELLAFDTDTYLLIRKAKLTFISTEEIANKVGLEYNKFQDFLNRRIMPAQACKRLEELLRIEKGSLVAK